MRILVIGSGGREHALSWKIAQSHKCEKLFCAPGNGGISESAELVNIQADDIKGLLKFAKANNIGLTVVGPEVPLVEGIVDTFQKEGLKVFGPSKDVARMEGSKIFAKEAMRRFGVPTADFKVFDKADEAFKYLDERPGPIVVKADGLCAGKGVVVAKSAFEAKTAVKLMMVDRAFGAAGDRVIIEERLKGEEASILVISDGTNVVPLASSQDHKRVFDGDRGPNTGGMGAYSPAPAITDAIFKKIMDSVIYPMINGLAKEGTPYKGVLYAGIMLTDEGPKTLEFNVRFGDPETQAILPRLKSDLVDIMEKAADGGLANYRLDWDPKPCVTVVLASGGYPGSYAKGMEIEGLRDARSMRDVIIFHAGTKIGKRASDSKDLYITSGGRVLDVTALGHDIRQAIDNCCNAVKKIRFGRMHYRKDIGHKAVKTTV
jgi:phosphoribosylamine---glycine ligase